MTTRVPSRYEQKSSGIGLRVDLRRRYVSANGAASALARAYSYTVKGGKIYKGGELMVGGGLAEWATVLLRRAEMREEGRESFQLRPIFRPGDRVQIEGQGIGTVLAVGPRTKRGDSVDCYLEVAGDHRVLAEVVYCFRVQYVWRLPDPPEAALMGPTCQFFSDDADSPFDLCRKCGAARLAHARNRPRVDPERLDPDERARKVRARAAEEELQAANTLRVDVELHGRAWPDGFAVRLARLIEEYVRAAEIEGAQVNVQGNQ